MNTTRDPLLQDALDALGLSSAVLVSAETRATDTRVWQVRHDGRLLAIRVLRDEQARVMEIERQSMQLARAAGVPVPEIINTACIDGQRPAMAIEWVSGETVGDVLLKHPRLVWRLGRQAGSILARIHAVSASSSLTENTNWIDRGTRNDPTLATALERLALQPASLLHLDFHPFNLIARGGRIIGVLDWTNSAAGDPRADIARTISIMQVTAPSIIGEHGARRMTLGLFTRAFLQGYYACSPAQGDLAPFFVWAGNWMLADIDPKLDQIPVANPLRLRNRIVQRTAEWRARAHLS